MSGLKMYPRTLLLIRSLLSTYHVSRIGKLDPKAEGVCNIFTDKVVGSKQSNPVVDTLVTSMVTGTSVFCVQI